MKNTTSTLTSPLSCTCAVVAAALMLSLTACDVKKTEDGKAPSVQVDPGKMPKYDVETAKVTTGTEQKVITVPKVEVTMPGEPTPTPSTPAAVATPNP